MYTIVTSNYNMKRKSSEIVLVIFVVYANLTALEWVIHKYVMHAYERVHFPFVGDIIKHESDAHWEHHHEVKSDMSLDIEHKEEQHKGLFFRYKATFILTLVLFVVLSLQFRVLNTKHTSNQLIFAIALFSTLTYSLLWNNFHPLMHGTDEIVIPGTIGISNKYQNHIASWIPQVWFEWMMYNHAQHHAVKGKSKGNYNIILPGFDYIMGTYHSPPCFDNSQFCTNEDLNACNQPKGCFTITDRSLKLLENMS